MSMICAGQDVRQSTVEMTIVRADGSVEPLGVVAFYHRNPLRRIAWHIARRIRAAIRRAL